MDDSKIIELFWARNEDAIAQTDAAYGRKLYCLANRILSSREDAEESVNDTYLKTWNVIPPQRPTFFYAFLASICRHLSFHRVDWNQAAKRKAEIEIGQITTKAIYKTDTYWDGWEKLELLQPQLAGIQLKNGTLIQLADAREGYQDEDALIYFVEYQSYEGTVELDQIESLAYYDRWGTDANGKKVPVYRYVSLS